MVDEDGERQLVAFHIVPQAFGFGERDQCDDRVAELAEALTDRERMICTRQSMDVSMKDQHDRMSTVIFKLPAVTGNGDDIE